MTNTPIQPLPEPEKEALKNNHYSNSLSSDGLQPLAEANISHQPDPTRYGDWERKGRCIDF